MDILKVIWRKIRPYRIGVYRFNEIILKQQGIERVKNNVEVLAMGSPHMACGFNPKFYSSGTAFNLASENLDLYTLEKLAQKYIPQLPKLKRVFLSFSVFSPGHEIDKGKNQELCFLLNHFYHIPYPHLRITNKLKKALNHRLKKWHTSELLLPKNFDGYCPIPGSAAQKQSDKAIHKRVAHHLRENNRPTDQTYLLEKIARLCQKRNIEFIVVITPCRKDYNTLLQASDNVLFSSLFKTQQNLQFKLLNLRCSPQFKESDFFNADHLNSLGAKKFTQMMDGI